MIDLTDLEKKALLRTIGFSAFVGLLLFVAGGPGFLDGWRYWLVFTLCSLALTLFFLQHDPRLIERRMEAGSEKDERQRTIRSFLLTALILMFVTAGIDHRLGWSAAMQQPLIAMALAVVALGFAIVFLTFRANGHANAIIDVDPDQHVVSSGPYALVRHPMYLGTALILLATPIALGSEWAFPWALAAVACLAWRLVEEERYLSGHLAGYDDYRHRTRYRLIPYVW